MSGETFTIGEANAALGQLRRVLDRVAVLRGQAREYGDRVAVLDLVWGRAVRDPANPDHLEHSAFRRAVSGVLLEMESIIQELIVERRVRFPPGGLRRGLLHFPYKVEGGWVYLCWHRDEARVTHWHEVETGCERRRPLPSARAYRRLGSADPARPE